MFGVPPSSIPDYLALVGDSSDGFPGLPGFGAKTASTLLARYGHLEDIPAAGRDWDVSLRGADRLAATLAEQLDLAFLFRRLATLDAHAPVGSKIDALEWSGPAGDFAAVCAKLDAQDLIAQAEALAGT